jgi:hypothetical protein
MLPLKKTYSDDFQTPSEALDYLLPYLRRDWIIWECAMGKGNLVKALREKGFTVIGTDILQGYDFLKWTPERFDCIVTNPPYSLKNEFLERCYELRKPFALLLPLTTLETRRRQRLFKEYGVEIIVLPRRINFETPSGKGSGSWFAVAWFTNWLNIGMQLVFV